MNEKKVAFWGTGNICRKIMDNFHLFSEDLSPFFFIDSNPKIQLFYGKKVIKPDDITYWKDYYYVISVNDDFEIRTLLKSHGLKYGEDYVGYHEYFNISKYYSFYKELIRLKKFVGDNPEYIGSRLLFVNLFDDRKRGELANFFKEYCKACNIRNIKVIIIGDNADIYTDEYIEKKFETKFYFLPIYFIHGYYKLSYEDNYFIQKLSDEEYKFAEKITAQFYKNAPKQKDNHIKKAIVEYRYLDEIFKLLKPTSVLNWYDVSVYDILKELTKKYNIPFGVSDYSIVPGTYQIVKNGIDYMCSYYDNPSLLLDKRIDDTDRILCKRVRDYICTNDMDTVDYNRGGEESDRLYKCDKTKPTVFLIGGDDYYFDYTFDKKSNEWKKNYGKCYDSVKEAAVDLSRLCDRMGWNFIFKPHPQSDDRNGFAQELLAPNSLYIKNLLIDDIINISDVIVSFTSAANYKAIMYGKPVVSIGACMMDAFGCTYVAENRDDIKNQIERAISNGVTDKMSKNFDEMYIRFLKYNCWDNLANRSFRYGNRFTCDYFEHIDN